MLIYENVKDKTTKIQIYRLLEYNSTRSEFIKILNMGSKIFKKVFGTDYTRSMESNIDGYIDILGVRINKYHIGSEVYEHQIIPIYRREHNIFRPQLSYCNQVAANAEFGNGRNFQDMNTLSLLNKTMELIKNRFGVVCMPSKLNIGLGIQHSGFNLHGTTLLTQVSQGSRLIETIIEFKEYTHPNDYSIIPLDGVGTLIDSIEPLCLHVGALVQCCYLKNNKRMLDPRAKQLKFEFMEICNV